jgi:hypothetical protein
VGAIIRAVALPASCFPITEKRLRSRLLRCDGGTGLVKVSHFTARRAALGSLLPNQIGEFYVQEATQIHGCANLQERTNTDYCPFDSFLGDFAVSTASSSFAEAGAGPALPLMISVAVTFLPYRS